MQEGGVGATSWPLSNVVFCSTWWFATWLLRLLEVRHPMPTGRAQVPLRCAKRCG